MTIGYQVLARKWRPRRFEDVVGQRAVVRTLTNALRDGRVAHAYCFSGIRGVGKTTAARLLAKGLNCRAGEQASAEPCGVCESCIEIDESRALDVIELDAASQTGVDNIRELTEVTRYAPSRDRYRVFIIDEAHMLSTSAFNALLKTLEEPPPHVVFMLATTEPNKILPTVLSRCQHYPFSRVSQRDISEHLARVAEAEMLSVSAASLALLAEAADGSLRDSLSLLDKLIAFAGESIDEETVVTLLGLVDRVLVYRATDLVAAGDVAGLLMLVNEMMEQGVDLHRFTVELMGHIRNLLVVHTVENAGELLHLPEGDMERLRQQAANFEIADLDRAFSLLAANEYRIKMSNRPRYHVEIALARLARLPRLEPIERLLAELRGGGDGTPSATPVAGGGQPRSAPPTGNAMRPAVATSTPATDIPPAVATPTPTTDVAAAVATPTPATDIAAAVTQPASSPPPPNATAAAPATAEPIETDVVELPSHLPETSLLARIQDTLHEERPMIARALNRAVGIELAAEAVVFLFGKQGAFFSDQINEPGVLQLLSSISSDILGRRAVARIRLVEGASVVPAATNGARARPGAAAPRPALVAVSTPPAGMSTTGTGPIEEAGGTASEMPNVEEPPPHTHEPDEPPPSAASLPAAAGAAASTAAPDSEPQSAAQVDLFARAMNEPFVQELVEAVKGKISRVDEARPTE